VCRPALDPETRGRGHGGPASIGVHPTGTFHHQQATGPRSKGPSARSQCEHRVVFESDRRSVVSPRPGLASVARRCRLLFGTEVPSIGWRGEGCIERDGVVAVHPDTKTAAPEGGRCLVSFPEESSRRRSPADAAPDAAPIGGPDSVPLATPKGSVARRISRPSEGGFCEAHRTGSRRRGSRGGDPLTEERPRGPRRWGEPCACPGRTL
jgi:hypothetical protein